MRRVGLVAALAFAAMVHSAPVRADPFESFDHRPLEICLENAAAYSDRMRRCIGTAATPCIAADGATTSSHVLCWSHEADYWRQRMITAAGYLDMHRTYRDPQRLAAANAAWEVWLEAECDYWAYEEGGGAGEQVDRARCYAYATAERAITLIEAGAEP